jgi:hypothetical protein
MKRFFFALMLMCANVVANAQTYYESTGDNVNVRSGPGKNYRVILNDGFETKCQLFKGNAVQYAGKVKNGFTYVKFLNCGMTGASCYPDYGWVSSKYLKKLTKKCNVCKGKGFFNRPCTDSEGSPDSHFGACMCTARYCLHNGCVGKQHCHNCDGLGYIQ